MEFQGGWTAPASKFTVTQPGVADGAEACKGPLCPHSSLLLEPGLQPPQLRPQKGKEPPLSDLELLFHKLLNKMEIRLTENKVSKKKEPQFS